MTILYILAGLYAFLSAFYALYVLVMGIYRAHLAGRVRWFKYILLGPFILLGLAVDVIANCTLAWVIFGEHPREWLVTTRLTRYIDSGDAYQKNLAKFICDELLDVFDPTGNHC